MRGIHWLSVGLLCFVWAVLETGAPCPYLQCACSETYMVCHDRSGTNMSAPVLSMDLNELLELPNKMLPPGLTEIYFTNSPLQTIGDEAFDDSATTLITISFTTCIITQIPDTFLHLKALKYLAITDTNIINWNPPAMINIGLTIETILLSNVGLTTWPSWLTNFSRVSELTIQASNISSIPDGAFDKMAANLTTLSLNKNKLISVPKALANLSNLLTLDLQENDLFNLTWLPPSKSLNALILNDNSISNAQHLSNALLPYTHSLSIIELQNNKLTSIPNLDFLINVGRLDFSGNRLSDVISGSLPPAIYEMDMENNLFPFIPTVVATLQSLSTLDMPSNLIMEIRGTDFAETITQVDLDNNQITELNEGSFPVNSRIDSLSLNNNPISVISLTAFQNLPELTTLSMINSRLTRVPVALASLKSLGSLDLTGSESLVCTCGDKGLAKWITSLRAEGVLGDCGLTSIYVFYSILSLGCPV